MVLSYWSPLAESRYIGHIALFILIAIAILSTIAINQNLGQLYQNVKFRLLIKSLLKKPIFYRVFGNEPLTFENKKFHSDCFKLFRFISIISFLMHCVVSKVMTTTPILQFGFFKMKFADVANFSLIGNSVIALLLGILFLKLDRKSKFNP